MNAVILAAGKSSRMYKSGAVLPKGLLPILEIPNIERTIFMLHMLDIYNIVIAVPSDSQEYDYLQGKYLCTVIHIPSDCKNTLRTMNYLIDYIDNTFIIESDVVCTKNVFQIFEHSTYYVMEYANPENDEWNVITDSDKNITGFEIGTHRSPAIFGISFWVHEDCPILIRHLKEKILHTDPNDLDVFWDDYIAELLNDISLKVYEISSAAACEMNTVAEYQYAEHLCMQMILSPECFFNNILIRTNKFVYSIHYNTNTSISLKWLEKLFNYYGETIYLKGDIEYMDWYSLNEHVCLIKDKSDIEIGFFSFAIHQKYILLRRLFIDSSFRKRGIGKKVLYYMQLYAISCKKELRINVYDKNAAKYYKSLGATKLFTTYSLNLFNPKKEF